jgi:hypothetical protein
MTRVWIVDNRTLQPYLRTVDAARLADGPNAPTGMVVWTPNSRSKHWHYVYTGITALEAAQKHNAFYEMQLAEEEERHQRVLAGIHCRMVKEDLNCSLRTLSKLVTLSKESKT